MKDRVRESFEAWAKFHNFNLTRGVLQEYWSGRTQGAWLAWQEQQDRHDDYVLTEAEGASLT